MSCIVFAMYVATCCVNLTLIVIIISTIMCKCCTLNMIVSAYYLYNYPI